MAKAKETISLGLCVNGAREEFRKKESGFYSVTLVKFLREELLLQIVDGSISKFFYRNTFVAGIQRALNVHYNLAHKENAASFAALLASRIDSLESSENLSLVGEFLDALCDSAGKAYDQGCPISIEV